MRLRPLGKTGLNVSPLGLGTGGLGAAEVMESDVAQLLGAALDAGVNLIDTARSYGLAEARLGRHLGARRRDVVLCTKGGYGVEGAPDWTGDAVTYGIHRALSQLRTDHLDVFFLHSCALQVAQREDMLEALQRAREAGKIRCAGYSGEGEALAWAIRSGAFEVVECSVNLVDQGSLALLGEAAERGVGVLAKRPLANACWTFTAAPPANDAAIYFGRFQKLKLDAGGLPWPELALRFAAFAPGVSSAIAGCRAVPHLEQNLRAIEAGPLPALQLASLRATWAAVGASWPGII